MSQLPPDQGAVIRLAPDPDPPDLRTFVERFQRNSYTQGVGALTQVHVACPFCGAAEWLIHGMRNALEAMNRGAVCQHCMRGAKFEITRTPHGTGMKLYQTVGPNPPAWMPDKPLRLVTHGGKDDQQGGEGSPVGDAPSDQPPQQAPEQLAPLWHERVGLPHDGSRGLAGPLARGHEAGEAGPEEARPSVAGADSPAATVSHGGKDDAKETPPEAGQDDTPDSPAAPLSLKKDTPLTKK